MLTLPRIRGVKALRRLNYSSVILTTGFVILFFNGGSRFAFGLVLKPMTEDLGWSRSSLSLAASVFFIVSALAMPLFGRLADRDSLRLVIAGAAAVGWHFGVEADFHCEVCDFE